MKRVVVAAVALLIVAGIAVVGYGIQQKRAQRAQLAQLVDASGGRFADTLGADIAGATAESADRLARLSSEADADLERLRAAGTRPDRKLAEAVESYLSGAAAVLKRQAASARGRLKFVASRKALADHLAKAGQRGEGWSGEAIRLKERLDADYFEYRIAATSLGNMLAELPAAKATLVALLPSAHVPDEPAIRNATARALAAAEAVRLEFERAKQLVPR